MEGLLSREESESLRSNNPKFAKLLDVISSTYLEDGVPVSTQSKLKQAERRLHTAKQGYLEQLVLTEELVKVIRSRPTTQSGSADDRSSCDRSGDLMCSAAELQHCLAICPDATLLGLQPVHLQGVVAEAGGGKKISHQALLQNLETSLSEKCLRVLHWHAPQQDRQSDSALSLAKMSQLPQLLSQQRDEVEKFEEEKRESKTRCRELMAKTVMVLSEMYREMKEALEECKLELTARANKTSLDFLLARSQAMIGKLDVMHHQLLLATCSDGRLQSLSQIRSHLLEERKRLTKELSQTRQVICSYETLGEEFVLLSRQYQEVKEDIENSQWALKELK